MDTATARVDDDVLDLIQQVRGRVPINEFRLLPDCLTCQGFVDLPATPETNHKLRAHIRVDHSDLVIVSSD